MIWRTTYSPRVEERFAAPPLPFARTISGRDPAEIQFLCAGFSVEAVPELGIWQRLFDEDAPTAPGSYRGVFAVDSREVTVLEASLPPSQHDKVLVLEWSKAWFEAVKTESRSQSFCWCRQSQLLVVGLPTEEVWDLVLSKIRA